MRLISTGVRLLVCTGLLAALGAIFVSPAALAAVPVPDDDPFYAVPSGIADLHSGTILASRQIQAMAGPAPIPARAWQLKYKTIDSAGHPTATITTVMVPDAPWLGPGPRPLVSYQVAEDGVALKCSASYALRAGLQAGDTDAEGETT